MPKLIKSKKAAILSLRITAGWTFYVWARLVGNMVRDKDHSRTFRFVHIALGIVSIVLGFSGLAVSNYISDEVGQSVNPKN